MNVCRDLINKSQNVNKRRTNCATIGVTSVWIMSLNSVDIQLDLSVVSCHLASDNELCHHLKASTDIREHQSVQGGSVYNGTISNTPIAMTFQWEQIEASFFFVQRTFTTQFTILSLTFMQVEHSIQEIYYGEWVGPNDYWRNLKWHTRKSVPTKQRIYNENDHWTQGFLGIKKQYSTTLGVRHNKTNEKSQYTPRTRYA